MTEVAKRLLVDDERSAVAFALRTLLTAKEELVLQRTETHRFRRADRKMLRVHRSLVKQTQTLAADLLALGATRTEIAAIISEARQIAERRRIATQPVG